MILRESPRASCECRQVPVRFAVAIRLRKAHFRCFSENFGVLVMSGARDPRRLGPRSGTSAPVRIIYNDPSENNNMSFYKSPYANNEPSNHIINPTIENLLDNSILNDNYSKEANFNCYGFPYR